MGFYLHRKSHFMLTKYMQKINTTKGLWLRFSVLERWFRKLHKTPESDSFAWPWKQQHSLNKQPPSSNPIASSLHICYSAYMKWSHLKHEPAPFFRKVIKNSNKNWEKTTGRNLLSSEEDLQLSELLFILAHMLSYWIEVITKSWNGWEYFRGDTGPPCKHKWTAVLSTFHLLPLW